MMGSDELKETADNSELFAKFANRMNLVGKVLILLGFLFVLAGLVSFKDHYGNFFEGIIQIVIGIMTVKASILFKKIKNDENINSENLKKAIIAAFNLYSVQLYFYSFIFFLFFSILISSIWTELI